jgi:hypothetical protein
VHVDLDGPRPRHVTRRQRPFGFSGWQR